MRVMRVMAVAAALFFILFLRGGGLAYAFSPGPGNPVADPGAGGRGFTIMGAYDGSYLYYEEKDTAGDILDRDYGYLNGLDIEARFESGILWTRLTADYSWSHGATYDGAVCGDGGLCTPAKFSTPERFDLYEGDLGFKLLNVEAGTLAPYVGIGRRVWWRGEDVSPDYIEKYSWYFAAIGLNYVCRIERWTAGADVAVDIPFNMRMTTNEAGNWDETNFKLRSNPAVVVQLPITYDIYERYVNADRVFVFLTPYYQHWAIGASDLVNVTKNGVTVAGSPYYEPDSTTNIYGARIGVGVNF
ncbi:MAG: hypothetical protein M0Z58_09530 [Nitrospiraceae bacterium]|nr:hypothetical protein [Nitrospiraceae bacterium]